MLFVYYLVCIPKVGKTTFGLVVDTLFLLIIWFIYVVLHECFDKLKEMIQKHPSKGAWQVDDEFFCYVL
jgi:hypothetical protein